MNSYSKIVKPNINQLINDHTNLVKKISWHLHGRVSAVIEIDDIIQIGMLGLISAAQNYTPQSDASFASYDIKTLFPSSETANSLIISIAIKMLIK